MIDNKIIKDEFDRFDASGLTAQKYYRNKGEMLRWRVLFRKRGLRSKTCRIYNPRVKGEKRDYRKLSPEVYKLYRARSCQKFLDKCEPWIKEKMAAEKEADQKEVEISSSKAHSPSSDKTAPVNVSTS